LCEVTAPQHPPPFIPCPPSTPHTDYPYNQQTPHRGLPLKHTPLTASTGSVTTLTTVADEERADGEVEELGRVAGWVASFDKLLADPLGVQCLLVSVRLCARS